MFASQHLINSLESLQREIPKIFGDVVNDHKEEVEDINAEQLNQGKDAEGLDLADYRSDSYARFKKNRGSKSSPVADLKLTGKYHKAITLKKTGVSDFQVTNTDSKFQELIGKYPDHLGLNDKGKQEMVDDFLQAGMLQEMCEYINKQLRR
jgi:hypothetical protein